MSLRFGTPWQPAPAMQGFASVGATVPVMQLPGPQRPPHMGYVALGAPAAVPAVQVRGGSMPVGVPAVQMAAAAPRPAASYQVPAYTAASAGAGFAPRAAQAVAARPTAPGPALAVMPGQRLVGSPVVMNRQMLPATALCAPGVPPQMVPRTTQDPRASADRTKRLQGSLAALLAEQRASLQELAEAQRDLVASQRALVDFQNEFADLRAPANGH
eukprot:TRINITY_DN36440_c0_g1_i1.p1 TRINITY_DN36440_c0_g1~~TRINITY_DN36440_c0_g1_i1.p1  ORF type:complete len:215 (+),score=44.36 TRINITY_DN36440_c0_g1_i1:73-717(+)